MIMLLWRTRGGPMDEYAAHTSLTHVPPTPSVTVVPASQSTTRDSRSAMMQLNHGDAGSHDDADSEVAESVPLCTQNQPAPDHGLEAAAHGAGLVLKHIHMPSQLHSLSLWKPVYTMLHLWRTTMQTVCGGVGKAGGGRIDDVWSGLQPSAQPLCASEEKTFTLIYLGASWCPPCMRFVNQMPELMEERLPRTVTSTVKADMDLAKPIFDFFGVEVIPTFIVLDNATLKSTSPTFAHGGGAGGEEASILAVMRRAELGRIQNSNMLTVSTFIEKHCCPLDLDCDF